MRKGQPLEGQGLLLLHKEQPPGAPFQNTSPLSCEEENPWTFLLPPRPSHRFG